MIAQGRASAGPVVEQVLAQIPDDELVPASKTAVSVEVGRSNFITPTVGTPMSDHAFAQLTSRLGMPTTYARELLTGARQKDGAWMGELLAQALSAHLAHTCCQTASEAVA